MYKLVLAYNTFNGPVYDLIGGGGARKRKLYLQREDILERYTDEELYQRFCFDRAGIEVCLSILFISKNEV